MKKRNLTAILALTLCAILLIAVPATAEAAELASGTCGDQLTWVLTDDGTLTISGTGDIYDYSQLDTPWPTDTLWSSFRYAIKTVILSHGITGIGANAFRDCAMLESITIPNSVTRIGSDAFRDCARLEDITIPNSVTDIGELAFYNCSSLRSITIPDSVTHIGRSSFCNCSSMTHVTIPDSVTQLDSFAFASCDNLVSARIGSGIRSIDESHFIGCSSLSVIILPVSITAVSEWNALPSIDLWHVLYEGSEEQWGMISGQLPTGFTVHFNCTGDEVTDSVSRLCAVCLANCSHSYDNDCDTVCNSCGATRTAVHTPGAAATATTDQTCTICGYVLAPATGENGEPQPTPPAEPERDGIPWLYPLFGIVLCCGCALLLLKKKK